MVAIRLSGVAVPAMSGGEALPVPVPVIGQNPVAYDGGEGVRTDFASLVTPIAEPYAPANIRYASSWFGGYYNRVFFIPRSMTLIDPVNGNPNTFYVWNAYFQDLTVSSYTVDETLGLSLTLGAGDVLPALQLAEHKATVSVAAPNFQHSRFRFTLSNASVAPFDVIITRTTLIRAVPERPVIENLRWLTNVLTARDGSEQRSAVRQLARQELKLNYIFDTPEEQFDIYSKILTQGDGEFSVPVWWSRGRFLADVVQGATQVEIDTSVFEVLPGDQFYVVENDKASIIKVDTVQSNGTTVALLSATEDSFTTEAAIHRVAFVTLPDKPSMNRGAFNNLTAELSVQSVEARELFTGTATFQEVGKDTILGDRVTTDVVYTLLGAPILHARPIVDGAIEEGFDWNFDILDYNSGPITRTTARIMAAATYARKFLLKVRAHQFYWNMVLKYCHGQRQPVWLPTWMEELGGEITQMFGTTALIATEQYLARFPAEESHRGLWIKYGQGWLARRILSAEPDGSGNTVLTLDKAVPDDYPLLGPHEVSFLVLARQASDDVQIERWPLYSFLTTAFTSTRSTSGNA